MVVWFSEKEADIVKWMEEEMVMVSDRTTPCSGYRNICLTSNIYLLHAIFVFSDLPQWKLFSFHNLQILYSLRYVSVIYLCSCCLFF